MAKPSKGSNNPAVVASGVKWYENKCPRNLWDPIDCVSFVVGLPTQAEDSPWLAAQVEARALVEVANPHEGAAATAGQEPAVGK